MSEPSKDPRYPMIARPPAVPRDFKTVLEEVRKKLSKTLEYLARN